MLDRASDGSLDMRRALDAQFLSSSLQYCLLVGLSCEEDRDVERHSGEDDGPLGPSPATSLCDEATNQWSQAGPKGRQGIIEGESDGTIAPSGVIGQGCGSIAYCRSREDSSELQKRVRQLLKLGRRDRRTKRQTMRAAMLLEKPAPRVCQWISAFIAPGSPALRRARRVAS